MGPFSLYSGSSVAGPLDDTTERLTLKCDPLLMQTSQDFQKDWNFAVRMEGENNTHK